MTRTALVFVALVTVACSSFSEVADSGAPELGVGKEAGSDAADDGPVTDAPAVDLLPTDTKPGEFPPVKKCRTIPLPCLDPAPHR